jgi:hypothetical protein
MNDPNLIADLKEALKREGVTDPDNLAVIQMANDSILGEVSATVDAVINLDPVTVSNPKRFVRVQRMDPNGGLNVEYAIIDFDAMLSGGQATVRPILFYWVSEAGPDGELTMLKMLLGYFDASRKRRAAAAGIHLDLDTTKFPAKLR